MNDLLHMYSMDAKLVGKWMCIFVLRNGEAHLYLPLVRALTDK